MTVSRIPLFITFIALSLYVLITRSCIISLISHVKNKRDDNCVITEKRRSGDITGTLLYTFCKSVSRYIMI